MSELTELTELSKMNFEELHSHDIAMAKKLEVVWIHPSSGIKHSMPFLSRNLLYVRRANAQRAKKMRARRPSNDNENANVSMGKEPSQKKPNLLLEVFGHRTVMYNDALLDSPRRATRMLTEAETKSATPVNDKKRKRDDTEDRSSNQEVQDHERHQSNNQTGAPKLTFPAPARRKSATPISSSQDGLSSGARPVSGDGIYLSSTARAKTDMYFHCLFLGDTGIPSIHTERRDDRRCPFCFHDAVSDSGLVAHLSSSHGENLVFQSARTEVGELHVTTSFIPRPSLTEGKEQLKDFVFVAPSRKILPAVPFVKRSARSVASMDMATRKKHVRLLEEMKADERQRQSYIPDDKVPIRRYFHSKTNLPMVGGDWDIDSDEDSTTDKWLQDITASLLDDFSDLTSDEKKFMKLWNQATKSSTVLSDLSIPGRCMAFIRAHWEKLKEHNLRHDLTLHLHNLWDHGLVSSDQIVECMMTYDSLATDEMVL